MSKIKYTREELQRAVSCSTSNAEVARRLGVKGGGALDTLKKYLTQWEIDTTHFTGQRWAKGKSSITDVNVRGDRNPFRRNSTLATKHIRQRIFRENLIPYFCKICGLDEWRDAPLNLELDHIDGDNRNNELKNLRWVCPNCHSQTETYCGKNINRKKHVSDEEFYDALTTAPNIRLALIQLGLTPKGANYARARHLLDTLGDNPPS